MKKLLFLCLTFLSVSASASPECDFWKRELTLIEARLFKVEDRLKKCEETRDCKDLELLKGSLEAQQESYQDNLESFCAED